MALQSKLFRGNSNLEAAAVSDPAHILPGASGLHIQKIQTAIILLDGTNISSDEIRNEYYGTSTANAVLSYKQARNIINTNYETHADNIVGKRTVTSLDRELFIKERTPPPPIQIRPLSYARICPPLSANVIALMSRLRPNFVRASAAVAPASVLTLVVPENLAGDFSVANAKDGFVRCDDHFIGNIRDPENMSNLVSDVPITKNDQKFYFFARLPGRGKIIATGASGTQSSLEVVVQNPRSATDFIPGIQHNHEPLRDKDMLDIWGRIRNNPNNDPDAIGLIMDDFCRNAPTPKDCIDECVRTFLRDKPRSVQHLNWYLRDGNGNDFNEDENIKLWLLRDKGIRKKLIFEVFRGDPQRNPPRHNGRFEFETGAFEDDEFRACFGSIDVVSYELDFSDGSIHVWFKDRYEWHPVYPGIYDQQTSDSVRNTNSLHAAMLEMKRMGAKDFWMKGEAFLPMSFVFDEIL